jgi:hypothetical protein
MILPSFREFIFKKHAASSFCDPAKINSSALGRLAFFPKIGVMYNRVRKNANSTTMIALSCLENGFVLGEKSAKRNAIRWHHLQTQFMDLSQFKRLLIVRDPYARTLSAFRDKFSKQMYIDRWGKFELSPRGYLDFLLWLRDGGLDKNSHWDLQIKSIAFPLESYSHVFKFENIEYTLFDFLRNCNAAISDESFLQSVKNGSQHATGSSTVINQFYGKESFRLVSELFEKDFLSIGYPFRD